MQASQASVRLGLGGLLEMRIPLIVPSRAAKCKVFPTGIGHAPSADEAGTIAGLPRPGVPGRTGPARAQAARAGHARRRATARPRVLSALVRRLLARCFNIDISPETKEFNWGSRPGARDAAGRSRSRGPAGARGAGPMLDSCHQDVNPPGGGRAFFFAMRSGACCGCTGSR